MLFTSRCSIGKQLSATTRIAPSLSGGVAHFPTISRVRIPPRLWRQVVKSSMRRAGVNLKIASIVVRRVCVFVMNNNWSPCDVNATGHGPAMLGNIAALLSQAVVRVVDLNIAATNRTLTAFPHVVRCAGLVRIACSQLVAGDVTQRMPGVASMHLAGGRCYRSWFSATAHAEAGRIRKVIRSRKYRARATCSWHACIVADFANMGQV